MIVVEGLSYNYHSDRQSKKISFPDFTVARGEQFLLLGESGSGKTTLLHLLGGLLRAPEGKINIEEVDITQLSEVALDQFRGKQVGFIFQRNHLIASLSVRSNLLLAPFLAGQKQDVQRADEVLDHLGMLEKGDSKIHELSQGQAQRVAIARAIMNKPSLILADEPTSALDDANSNKVIELLIRVAIENNAALIVATHDHRLKGKLSKQIEL